MTNEIINRLKYKYKNPKTALNYTTVFELLVATILSAQCTDERVNKITPFIFQKYKDSYGFAIAQQEILEQEIKPCGFYKNKSKSIIEMSKRLVDNYSGNVPNTMEDLLTLRGVARKTANIILSSFFKISAGIAVDTHVARLAKRFNFTTQKDPNKIEKDLLKIFDKNNWIIANYLLVEHGRHICKAIKPLCASCFLNDICPFFKLKKPFVTIKFAQSLDGKIATKNGVSQWISNQKTLEFAHKLRAENDAILIGINTVLKDNPTLNTRLVEGKNPIRVILDSGLKIPFDSKIVLSAKKIKTFIFTSSLDDEKINILKNNKIKIFKLEKILLKDVLKILYENNVKKLLVEGGSQIITSFIEENLFDKINIVIAPILIGNDGIPAFKFIGNIQIPLDKALKISEVIKIDNNILVKLEKNISHYK